MESAIPAATSRRFVVMPLRASDSATPIETSSAGNTYTRRRKIAIVSSPVFPRLEAVERDEQKRHLAYWGAGCSTVSITTRNSIASSSAYVKVRS
jgi:hypothetical protein